eukprot:GHVN01061761.1.p1 GENE.GHVN01061761.1~~GHVN01061761.1.p1  ORF type:complete len:158 (+),score=49.90 GHVN01061761.1:34-507(+)
MDTVSSPLKGLATAFSSIASRDLISSPTVEEAHNLTQLEEAHNLTQLKQKRRRTTTPILSESTQIYSDIARASHEAYLAKKEKHERRLTRRQAHFLPQADQLSIAKDKLLKRLATKGVVKVFNAVIEVRKGGSKKVNNRSVGGKREKKVSKTKDCVE